MFRSMRRSKQQLTQAECIAVLEQQPRGVLAVHGENGYPYAFPMDFYYAEGKLYFHCAREGTKLDALAADDRVSFCVMDQGFRKPGEWPLNIRSVIVFGRVKKLEPSAETTDLLRRLALKYYPTPESAEAEIEKAAARVQLLVLTVDHMTGKLVNES